MIVGYPIYEICSLHAVTNPMDEVTFSKRGTSGHQSHGMSFLFPLVRTLCCIVWPRHNWRKKSVLSDCVRERLCRMT
jgi:hypothetical protein